LSTILEVEDLHKSFTLHMLNGKHIRALEGISFAMEEGEIVGLAGKSGAGKSTLMKCIYRTYLPSSGQIRLRAAGGEVVDLAVAGEHEILGIRKTEMTYCSQFLHAIPRVPAIEVVCEGLIRRAGREEALRAGRECFQRLGLPEELWDAYPSTFSGGEQQRINISRAIISQPRFLLVDEPTASLDLKTKNAVIDMMLELKARGTSIILITHDEHTLRRTADRCIHLEAGRVLEMVRV
jgi:alpha-D-ribose 1-methylphosphonate 5-triphosphate synthase subunit PhnL